MHFRGTKFGHEYLEKKWGVTVGSFDVRGQWVAHEGRHKSGMVFSEV